MDAGCRSFSTIVNAARVTWDKVWNASSPPDAADTSCSAVFGGTRDNLPLFATELNLEGADTPSMYLCTFGVAMKTY